MRVRGRGSLVAVRKKIRWNWREFYARVGHNSRHACRSSRRSSSCEREKNTEKNKKEKEKDRKPRIRWVNTLQLDVGLRWFVAGQAGRTRLWLAPWQHHHHHYWPSAPAVIRKTWRVGPLQLVLIKPSEGPTSVARLVWKPGPVKATAETHSQPPFDGYYFYRPGTVADDDFVHESPLLYRGFSFCVCVWGSPVDSRLVGQAARRPLGKERKGPCH